MAPRESLLDPVRMTRSEFDPTHGSKLDLSHFGTLTEAELKGLLQKSWDAGRLIETIVVSSTLGKHITDTWPAPRILGESLSLFAKFLTLIGWKPKTKVGKAIVNTVNLIVTPYGTHQFEVKR
jgi:hypothetical protein